MDDLWKWFAGDMVARLTGPMQFRLFMQPAMAMFFAIRSGLADAREGRPPYFWALLTGEASREEMIESGWKSISRVFILAVVLDVVYQLIVYRWVYPIQALTVAFILAIIPYVVVRGLVTRLAQTNRRVPADSSVRIPGRQ